MKPVCRCAVALLVPLVCAAGSRAASPFDNLLKRIPEQANAVLVMDVQAAQKSPLGVREKWAEKHRQTALGGLTSASPSITRVAAGMQVNPVTLQNTWEVALIQLERAVTLADLTKAVTGSPDSMSGLQVVLSPQNAYFVPFEPRVVGMMRPADRQVTARWVQAARGANRVGLSPYLRQAVESMPKNAQALMALDLENVLDPEGIRQRIKTNKVLAGKGLDPERLAKLLLGLNGVTLTLRVDEAINGQIRVDFDEPADMLTLVAKPLLLNALERLGASVPDLDSWQSRIAGKSVILEGKLSEEGQRRILSPFLRPAAMNIAEAQAPNSPGQDPKAVASQRYFRSVQTLLNDLKNQKTKTFQQLAYWYSQFSDKIDALPMLNVDEELLKYGAAVSTTLDGLANLANNTYAAQKAAVNNSGEALIQVPNAYNYYGGGPGWGYGYSFPGSTTVNNYRMTNNMIAKSGQTEAAIRLQTWKNIDTATTDIRRKMVQQYQVEF